MYSKAMGDQYCPVSESSGAKSVFRYETYPCTDIECSTLFLTVCSVATSSRIDSESMSAPHVCANGSLAIISASNMCLYVTCNVI